MMYDTGVNGMFLYQLEIRKKNSATKIIAIMTPQIRLPIEKLIISANPDNIIQKFNAHRSPKMS